MTLNEFQRSREWCADFSKLPSLGDIEGQGFVYAGGLVDIQLCDKSGFPQCAGMWMLVLGNSSEVSDDLMALEIKLWVYAVNELGIKSAKEGEQF